jgi:hypothetical protein
MNLPIIRQRYKCLHIRAQLLEEFTQPSKSKTQKIYMHFIILGSAPNLLLYMHGTCSQLNILNIPIKFYIFILQGIKSGPCCWVRCSPPQATLLGHQRRWMRHAPSAGCFTRTRQRHVVAPYTQPASKQGAHARGIQGHDSSWYLTLGKRWGSSRAANSNATIPNGGCIQ